MFLVVIQLGAIMAVVVIYFHKLNPFSPRKSAKEKSDTWQIWGKVIIGCLPAAIIGLPLNDWLDEHFYNYVVVAIALIVYGIIFIWIETRYNYKPTVQDFDQMSYLTAFKIGCFQVLSLILDLPLRLHHHRWYARRHLPHRCHGILLLHEHSDHVRYQPLKARQVWLRLHSLRTCILLFGMVVAFFVSILAIKFLVSYVSKNDFKIFGYYRIVLGVIVLAYFFLS